MLALANASSMKKFSFSEIEKQIGPVLCRIAEEAMSSNLDDEVEAPVIVNMSLGTFHKQMDSKVS